MVFIVKLVIPVPSSPEIVDQFQLTSFKNKKGSEVNDQDSTSSKIPKKVTMNIQQNNNNSGKAADPSDLQIEELNMEEAVKKILLDMEIRNDVWCTTQNKKSYMVEFYVISSDQLDTVLNQLAFYNVGKIPDSLIVVTEATASVVPLNKAATLNANDDPNGENAVSSFQKFLNSLKSRLTVAQVYNAISQRGDFTVDYLAFIICAAVLADVALVTNRPPVLFASMLLSPMMDPILCVLFGLRLRERNLIKKGVKNTLASIGICFAVGLILGIVTHAIANFEVVTPYPTPEITSRGTLNYLPNTAIVTVFSGVSTAFAILNNVVSAMIGNAISLSILPPAVNSGHLVFLSMLSAAQKYFNQTTIFNANGTSIGIECNYDWVRRYELIYMRHTCRYPEEFAIQAAISMVVTILNIVCILIIGYLVCIAKDFAPSALTNHETKKFYKEDIKEVQEAIRTVKSNDLNARKLAQAAFEEYKRCMGIDPENVADNDLAAEDFSAVMAAVEKDPHYLTIRGKCSEAADLIAGIREFAQNETLTNERKTALKRQMSMMSRVRQVDDELSPLRSESQFDSDAQNTVRLMRRPRSVEVSSYERQKLIQEVTHKMTKTSPKECGSSNKSKLHIQKPKIDKFEVTSVSNV